MRATALDAPVHQPVFPPHVEPDPEDEATRQAILKTLDPDQQQRWANHPLWLLKHRQTVCTPDPTVYEAWFARQPSPGSRRLVDLGLLRWVLKQVVIDSETLHWLGGKEIERLCRAAAVRAADAA